MRLPLNAAALAAVALIMACTDLPTSASSVIIAPTPARYTSFSNAGPLAFSTGSSGCALQSGNLVCNFTATGLEDDAGVSMHYWVTWSIPMQCVHQKTGKLAPEKRQPANPWVWTQDGGATGYGWTFSGGQLSKSNYILYAPSGFSSEYFCGKGPYTLQTGTASATYWKIQLVSWDDTEVWAEMWDFPT